MEILGLIVVAIVVMVFIMLGLVTSAILDMLFDNGCATVLVIFLVICLIGALF